MKKKQFKNTGIDMGLVSAIESGMEKQKLLNLLLKDHNSLDVFAHRILFLDKKISLIYEHCPDRRLMYLYLEKIGGVIQKKDTGKTGRYSPSYSPLEVNDFITALRAVSGEEVRLVLKILAGGDHGININPDKYHFMGNPCIIANKDGDRIWAATLEFSEEIYEWLFKIRNYIEIIDPVSIKIKLMELERKETA